MKRLFTTLAFLVFAVPALAQQGVPGQIVQQSATDMQACTSVNANGAVNATATVTITPPNGQSVYLCGLDISISADATGGTTATNLSFTSTNIGGWQWKFSWAGTVSTNLIQIFNFVRPIKSTTPGTAVTIVSPAAGLHNAYNINAYYYFAP